ncbi:unnamed protein product [Effrenium voratum]|nr:unnamed protein product [Effrenium voratum]
MEDPAAAAAAVMADAAAMAAMPGHPMPHGPPMMPPMHGPPGMIPMMPDMPPHPAPDAVPEARAPKRRRLKGLDANSLEKLLRGLYQCLRRLVDVLPDAAAGPNGKEAPVHALEEEFEQHWRLRFDARAMGESGTAAFLRRFPSVFKVRSNGIAVLVTPLDDPNFDDAAAAGLEQTVTEKPFKVPDGFAISLGEQVIAALVNLAAEDKKPGSVPLNCQYASFEVAQELLAKLKDGGSQEEEKDLVNQLLDPKPRQPKEEPLPPEDFGMVPAPVPPRNFGSPAPPPSGASMGGPPPYGGKGGGFGKGGSRICRQFQFGRCSWGENCRFVHERQ